MTDLIRALWITLIGMGLLFVALLIVWGLMELGVRLTAKSALAEEAAAAEEEGAGEEEISAPEPAGASVLRQRAAAAAVAVALATQADHSIRGKGELVVGPAETMTSAWQAVLRGTQLNRQSAMYTRKQRSNMR